MMTATPSVTSSASSVLGDFPEGCAVVIGGSGGVGRAICRRLAECGSDVALTYRHNADAGAAAVSEVEAHGRRGLSHSVDITDEAAVKAFIDQAADALGPIHTVVVASGFDIRMAHVSEISVAELQDAVRNDLFGFYNVVHAALPRLREAGGGSFVIISSAALAHYSPKDLLSVAPKGGIEAIMRAVAREEGRFGIRANSVAMGVIDGGVMDRLWKGLSPEFIAKMKAGNALRRMGTPDEAADAAVFLASRRAAYITGQRLVLDGGYAI